MVIRATTVKNRHRSIVGRIRARIEAAGERVWRATDFQCADRAWTAQAIAQSLSRLSRQGVVRRLGKGLYYRGRETAFGPSLPSPAMVQSLPIAGRKIFPSGHAAASVLGLTTQQPARPEIATTGGSLPRLIVGKHAIVRTRRPESWHSLDADDAAILEVLRQRGDQRAFGKRDGEAAVVAVQEAWPIHAALPRGFERAAESAPCLEPSASSWDGRPAISRGCGAR